MRSQVVEDENRKKRSGDYEKPDSKKIKLEAPEYMNIYLSKVERAVEDASILMNENNENMTISDFENFSSYSRRLLSLLEKSYFMMKKGFSSIQLTINALRGSLEQAEMEEAKYVLKIRSLKENGLHVHQKRIRTLINLNLPKIVQGMDFEKLSKVLKSKKVEDLALKKQIRDKISQWAINQRNAHCERVENSEKTNSKELYYIDELEDIIYEYMEYVGDFESYCAEKIQKEIDSEELYYKCFIDTKRLISSDIEQNEKKADYMKSEILDLEKRIASLSQ